MLARKATKQSYAPSPKMLELMNDYRKMSNDVIRIGIANSNVSTLNDNQS